MQWGIVNFVTTEEKSEEGRRKDADALFVIFNDLFVLNVISCSKDEFLFSGVL